MKFGKAADSREEHTRYFFLRGRGRRVVYISKIEESRKKTQFIVLIYISLLTIKYFIYISC